ncbi:MAG TPA: MmpS family transport accessory protein [Pseudonocardia sp.]|uniref:MmpS family transport accessory protein n=1 Tax=Pseudonocardia sp. TaxID=60912 RepID=UPI002BE9E2F1|nr:MmpS family transport accessory protein [Pseudonocardia sp.]HTF49781.1 MmpS family transport accessory protein [Pseudonocardia sp.]
MAVGYGLAGVVLLAALLAAALQRGDRALPPAQPPPVVAASPHHTPPSPALTTVEYEVSSDGPAVDVTYVDLAGVHNLFDVPAPWSTVVRIPTGPMLGAYVTARAAGRATIVSCRILVDGARVAAMSVKGPGPVTCYPGDG